ncbi:RNA-binding S4 domain-containing protein [Pelagerythrobacter rhizovicinus]|uniref:RNA-binding S4 domain-containing protein n=1 Tax=Pelagerythrobacter rhizovicinus TaxID=2268576 RepID=A0A4Q2KLG1_9SPHN|nr:S4 domain-containing protein [Pelagerythrobacter rhizovicinus]RXZ65070.1 RNA-binding S4 domain-containing protein [Pelagerythrobacter rhizovicinus]
MRIDRLLCHLRFVKTRARAQSLVEAGHVRRNGQRVVRPSQAVAPGDVLTFPVGKQIHVIELLALPTRRGPAPEARACYRALDPEGQTAIAAAKP